MREFVRVGIDRNFPFLHKVLNCANVVEVAVGQQDGFRLCPFSEVILGPMFDLSRRKIQTRIDQSPAVATGDGKDVDKEYANAFYTRSDVVERNSFIKRKGDGVHMRLLKH